jgi:hypothetical protein
MTWLVVLVTYLAIGNAVTAPVYINLRDRGILVSMSRGQRLISYLVTVVFWWWSP